MCSFHTPFSSASSKIKNAQGELDVIWKFLYLYCVPCTECIYWRYGGMRAYPPGHVFHFRDNIFGWNLGDFPRRYVKLNPSFIVLRDLKHSWMWSLFNKTRSYSFRLQCFAATVVWIALQQRTWVSNKWTSEASVLQNRKKRTLKVRG
jgi:hypothetical protein